MAHLQSTRVINTEAGSIARRQINIPPGAVALVGLTYGNVGAFTRHVTVEVATNEFQRILGFIAFRGLKSSTGCYPVDDKSVLLVGTTVASADAALTYDIIAHFLMPDKGDPATILPVVPFKATGGDDQVVSITATSAANTAQTVDVSVLGNVDGIQPLAAWFYNSGAGTSTGETDAFDGTTAVTIDSTTAVAEYTFNLGAKGSQLLIADPVGALNVWRTVIGAGGAGITTTLVLVYRAVMLR